MGETTQTQNPLELVGGFDSYQNRVYQEILKRVSSWTVKEVREYDDYLTKNFLDSKVEGLAEGLLGLVVRQRPLTYSNLGYLQEALNFTISGLFREQLEPHLKSPNPSGIPVPSLVEENGRLHRRTGEYLELILSIVRESDKIISERKVA